MPRPLTYIHSYNCITPLGMNIQEVWNQLLNNRSGVKKRAGEEFYTGYLDTHRIESDFTKQFSIKTATSRLEKMLLLALQPLVEKHPVTEHSLLILSTTKGNINLLKKESPPAPETHLYHTAQIVAKQLGFNTPPVVVSNACVSGVMAVLVAKRLLQSGSYKNAFVVAGDELSEFVMAGFESFMALSKTRCAPYSPDRDGINLGEAAAAIYMDTHTRAGSFEILGEGAVNDANHISGPSRTGEGLAKSIQRALAEAQLSAQEIDYLSAHGTATLYNDEMESLAFHQCGLSNVPTNSLKAYFGHTLGASGLLELVVALKSVQENMLIQSLGSKEGGVSKPIRLLLENQNAPLQTLLKTASGFGGSNAAVIVKKIS